MSLISLLTQKATQHLYEFTGDNTLIQVPIAATGPGSHDLQTQNETGGQDAKWLIIGENINILSVGIGCPHAYVLGGTYPIIKINAFPNTGVEVVIYDGITVPFMNVDIPINKRINLEDVQNQVSPIQPCKLSMDIYLENLGNVSQLNAPDVMNDEDVPIYLYALIEHNFALTNAP